MELIIRKETEKDFKKVELLTYQAFLEMELPGREVCDEHVVVHKLRQSPAYVPELSLVAEVSGKVVGHLMLTKGSVVGESEKVVLILGPVSVLPEFQNRGIGSKLIKHGNKEACRLGYSGIILFGHPEYYPRFGFENAAKFDITTATGENFDAFMALELNEGSLQAVKGKFFYDSAFEVDHDELKAFDEVFLEKLPKKT